MTNITRVEYALNKQRNIIYAVIRKIIGHRKFKRYKYNGKKIADYKTTNEQIYNALMGNSSFLAARFGDTELRTIMYTIEIKLGLRKEFPEYIKQKMEINAGFFPANDENLFKFGELMLESCGVVDLYGVWFNMMEDFIINKYSNNYSVSYLEALEPYRYDKPWSKALEGKKVLVIHPFEDSILRQYENREKLFENKNVLPKFELVTLKAIQSNAGSKAEFVDWFEALDYMYKETKKLNFDVAILGCGAYGFPLATKLKRDGKKVIHLGGATQLLFGIRGARWDIRPEMQHLFNESWIRPSKIETPSEASKVEGACYW